MNRLGRRASVVAALAVAGAFLAAAPAAALDTHYEFHTNCNVSDPQQIDPNTGQPVRFNLLPIPTEVDVTSPTEVEVGERFTFTSTLKIFPPIPAKTTGIHIKLSTSNGAKPATFTQEIAVADAPSENQPLVFGPFSQQITAPTQPGAFQVKVVVTNVDLIQLYSAGELIEQGLVNNICDQVRPPEFPPEIFTEFDGILATINAVEPPPPGAPDAKADSVTVAPEVPNTVDVLANDVPNEEGPIDAASLAVVTQGTKGTAEIVDGKLVYTANAGTNGSDNVTYTVCTEGNPEACDVTSVAVAIEVGVDTAAPTTTAPPAPETTVAPAATNQLPKTGSNSTGLAVIAVIVLGGGLLLLQSARRRNFR